MTVVSRSHVEGVALARGLARWTTAVPHARRWATLGLLASPGLAVALLDLQARQEQIRAWPRAVLLTYLLTLVIGGVLWAALVAAASSPRAWLARGLLLTAAAMALGAQFYFFGRYHAFMNPRAVVVGTSMMPSVGQQLWSDRASFLRALVPPLALATLLPLGLRRWAPVSPRRGAMALDVGIVCLLLSVFCLEVRGGGEQAASPDVLYLSSMGKLAYARWEHDDMVDRAHPGPRTPAPLAPIAPRAGRPSVLLVVTESVRGADACSVPTPGCQTTPYTNAQLPGRFGFSQMRALDSTTAVSLAVLWSGLSPTATRDALHTAPLLWEYAHAAGFDTGYWTAQNLFFANSGTWLEGLPVSHWVSATDLDADPTYEVGADDGKLVDAALRDLPTMHAPFVGVVHLSNTHFPYVVDDSDAPFQPQSPAFGAGDASRVLNRYRDAIRRQDAIVARLMRGLRALPGGDHVVVAFVSDHGEQIRERGAIGHTWGVYDEEVRVPFWIDAPAGTLTDEQTARLRALQDAPLTQLDVLPTVLDVMGILEAPQVAPYRTAMPGESLLRGGTAGRAVVLTNCSGIFACAFKNWGAMQGTHKLVATQNDAHWKCFDVADDPGEHDDLGSGACGPLADLAAAGGRGTPF